MHDFSLIERLPFHSFKQMLFVLLIVAVANVVLLYGLVRVRLGAAGHPVFLQSLGLLGIGTLCAISVIGFLGAVYFGLRAIWVAMTATLDGSSA